MADISDVVQVTISRETKTVSLAGFGVPGIVAKFATSKTTVEFDRFRTYASLTEMASDGWAAGDEVYDAAAKIFSQNPNPGIVFVGRWDSGDANLTAALNAIQLASGDWYTFSVVGQKTSILTFSADFVTDNSIVVTVNGTAVTAVAFTTDQATTMSALETQIETDISGSVVTVSDTRELTIVLADEDVVSSAVVTGGASQPTASSYSENNTVVTDSAAWAETQKKIFFHSADNPDVFNSGVSNDIASTLKASSYDRSVTFAKKNADNYIETASPGEALPYDPGSQTWAFKTLSGVAVDALTSSESKGALDKNANTYENIANNNVTRYGKTASGEYIDIIRGIDFLEAQIQTEVFTKLLNARKVPYDDSGIQLIEGALAAALDTAVGNLIIADDYVISVPKFEDISATDKGNRNLPDVEFTATLIGAVHTVQVSGVVTL